MQQQFNWLELLSAGQWLVLRMGMWRKQLHTLHHSPLLVIVEPILTRLEAGNDQMPCLSHVADACWRGELSQQPMCPHLAQRRR